MTVEQKGEYLLARGWRYDDTRRMAWADPMAIISWYVFEAAWQVQLERDAAVLRRLLTAPVGAELAREPDGWWYGGWVKGVYGKYGARLEDVLPEARDVA